MIEVAIENPSREEIGEILKTKKTIAVVGMTNNPEKPSFMIPQAMLQAGYEIIPVNPTLDEVLGLKVYPSLKDIDVHVDIVNIFRRSEKLPAIAKETVEIGADVFWAQSGIANEEAYNYLKEHGVTVIMDRCIKVEHAISRAK